MSPNNHKDESQINSKDVRWTQNNYKEGEMIFFSIIGTMTKIQC